MKLGVGSLDDLIELVYRDVQVGQEQEVAQSYDPVPTLLHSLLGSVAFAAVGPRHRSVGQE